MSLLKSEVMSKLDPWQFAYRQGRSTDDAVGSITHLVSKHLDDSKAYARLLFIDFSSAFNTLQPYLLLEKLKQMDVNPCIIKWYFSFLTNRTQQVKVNGKISNSHDISTGAPQGCVSSPVLFTLYTNSCVRNNSNNYIVKFSDDTAILSLLYKDQDILSYGSEIDQFIEWCDANHLIVNVKKTEEMIFDPKSIGNHSPIYIHDVPIVQVSSYKYIGVYVDCSLTWQVHIDTLCTRLQQRLYFLRRLRLYGVSSKIMMLFYQAVLENVISYGIHLWYGNLTVHLKSRLGRFVRMAMRIMGRTEPLYLQTLYEKSTLREANKILHDTTHALHSEFVMLPSGRRLRMPSCRLNRFKNSFIPSAVKLLNNIK